MIFNVFAAVLGLMNMLKWSPITIDEEVGGTPAAPEGIAADVATHAMGHAAPSEEAAAAEAVKKDLPPMLSAEPEEPVVNHGIVTDSPVPPAETPVVSGGELNQAALDPLTAPTAASRASSTT